MRRSTMKLGADSPVSDLYGVGPKKADMLSKIDINTLGDLCYHFPRAYEFRGNVKNIEDTVDGEICSLILTVLSRPVTATIKRGFSITKINTMDDTGKATLIYYNSPYISDQIHEYGEYRVYGKIKKTGKKAELTNPVCEKISPVADLPPFTPVYPLTSGINQKFMAGIIKSALDIVLEPGNEYGIGDILPYEIKKKYSLCDINYALRKIHFPDSKEDVDRARRRLAFDEIYLFTMQSLIAGKREKNIPGKIFDVSSKQKFIKSIGFDLTGAQKRTIEEISGDLTSGKRMSRLVTGDVGSGKTVCAAYALYTALENGCQAALMAPTEILASQHYRSLCGLFEKLGYECMLLTGSLSASKKKAICAKLLDGKPVLLIGTHALIEDTVVIPNLGLIVIDEQHRFGAAQRDRLKNKSRNCHLISMSATPIPRTLALVLYGDLSISQIDEMPPGRQTVDTYLVDETYRERIDSFIRKNVDAGGQVYVVCPSIEEQETIENECGDAIPVSLLEDFMDKPEKPKLKAAVSYAEELSHRFPEYRIGFIHGKLKGAAKDKVMTEFVNGDLDILVSTTVIEVGVNVPNASLMIIENAEFFGLSGLHQLRGRVGRGNRKSYCVMFSDTASPKTRERLEVLKNTHDGYKIAEYDLKQRGPGDFLAESGKKIRQSGDIDLKLAEMIGDRDMLYSASESAKLTYSQDPELEDESNTNLRRRLDRYCKSLAMSD